MLPEDNTLIQQTPTQTPTNTATVSPTQTQTQTPTKTSNAVCPEQFIVTNSTTALFDNGTYNRIYSASGITFQYGYCVTVSINNGYVVLGTAPDGNNYPIFELYDGSDYNTVMANFSGPSFSGFVSLEQTPSILGSGVVWVGGWTPIGAGFTDISGVRFPSSGQKTGGYLSYPVVCPTPTSTQTPTTTPTQTPSNTPTETQTPTQTET